MCFSGTQPNTIYVGASNIGNYGYSLNPINATVKSYQDSTYSKTYAYTTTISDFYTYPGKILINAGTQLPSQLYITFMPITDSTAYGALYLSNIYVKNFYNSSVRCNIDYGFNNLNFFFDTLSITVLNNTLDSNYYINNNNFQNTVNPYNVNYGARVESGTGQYPTTFGATFNNTCNLTIGQYSNEIQLTNGEYRTLCNARFNRSSNGYLDYTNFYKPTSSTSINFDYTVINTFNTPKQYLTLAWYFASKPIKWYEAVFTFTWIRAPIYNSINKNFPGLDIYYKIKSSTTSKNTAWLNANSNSLRPPAAGTSVTQDPNGTIAGIRGNPTSLTVYLPSNTNYYYNTEFTIYLRIGIPSASNVSLKYVELTALQYQLLKTDLL